MIFHEVYGRYYRAVQKILAAAVAGRLDKTVLQTIVSETAFSESLLDIPYALQSGAWPLITKDYATPLRQAPSMPLTLLEKRWLKTISLDPRFQLFAIPGEAIPDVEPLFLPEDILYYNRYTDGDPYGDADYIDRFRKILAAMKEERALHITHYNRYDTLQRRTGYPVQLEYSDRDDKFRLLLLCEDYPYRINLARITDVRPSRKQLEKDALPQEAPDKEKLVLELIDERNALERLLLQLSHYEKKAERTGERTYRVEILYNKTDVTDLLIQILSFGAVVQIKSPSSMRKEARARIEKQTALLFSENK